LFVSTAKVHSRHKEPLPTFGAPASALALTLAPDTSLGLPAQRTSCTACAAPIGFFCPGSPRSGGRDRHTCEEAALSFISAAEEAAAADSSDSSEDGEDGEAVAFAGRSKSSSSSILPTLGFIVVAAAIGYAVWRRQQQAS
jgi:hypothetical protein